MKKVFLDTNIVLDLLLDRAPFAEDIIDIFDIAIDQSVSLCISSLTIANINYIIGRIEGAKKANRKTDKILQLVSVEPVSQSTVLSARKSSFKDFEDAIQNFCALESNYKVLVTRKTKDFRSSQLSIMNPKEFLAKLEEE